MSLEEAVVLARRAVRHATYRDAFSGNVIFVCLCLARMILRSADLSGLVLLAMRFCSAAVLVAEESLRGVREGGDSSPVASSVVCL